MKVTAIRVDRKKLKEALNRVTESTGKYINRISQDIGYSSSYLSQVMSPSGGVISKSAVFMLERVFGIARDVYVIEDEVQVEMPVQAEEKKDNTLSITLNIDTDKLYQLVFTAAFEAAKKAYKEI